MSDARVALTFDAEHPSRAGNDPRAPDAILDALATARVPATFFVQGRWASAHPRVARRIAEDGHLVGNHSHYHAPMLLLTAEGFRVDVAEAERRIADIVGVDPRPWFRCPFGGGADRRAVLEALHALGYRDVGWDVDPEDWREGRSPDDVRGAAVDGARLAGGVVLFHTWPSATAAALPGIIAELRDVGLSFVTVADSIREAADGP